MAATVKSATSGAGCAGVVHASSSAKTGASDERRMRPYQRAVEIGELTQQEREELADLLEAEFARL